MQADELLDEFKIPYLRTGHHHCRDGWVQIKTCRFCGSDNYHLGVKLSGNYAVCWRCGGHSLWNVLVAYGFPLGRIKQAISSLDRVFESKRAYESSVTLKEPIKRGVLKSIHREYLKSRGFGQKVIDLWQLEGIGIHPHLGWRIYIPIHFKGERVSWTTRAIGRRVTQRYLSASESEESVPHKHCVYGLDFCQGSIVICEGPTDAWAIGPGAGALFGTAFTPAQVLLLADIPRRYICFDSSDEAQNKARELGKQLSVFGGVTENFVIDSKDPGCASKKEIAMIRRAAGLER